MKLKRYKIIRRNMAVYHSLKQFIDNHDKFKKSYFWTPPSNKSGRRQMEFSTTIHFVLNEVEYKLYQEVKKK